MITYGEALILIFLLVVGFLLLVTLHKLGRRSRTATLPRSVDPLGAPPPKERAPIYESTPASDELAVDARPPANYLWHILPHDPKLHEGAIEMLENGWKYDSRQIDRPGDGGGAYVADGLPTIPPRRLR